MEPVVLYEVNDGVATVTINRPDRLNAQNTEVFEEALVHLEDAATDDNVRVVVLTGAGRAFCAGGDIAVMNSAASGPAPSLGQRTRELRVLTHTSQLLHEMPKVTIAAINGAVAGGGLSWATACDLRYAADSAKFVTAFVDVGISGDFGISWSLPRVVGPAKARELLFFSPTLDAAQATQIGLVNDVFPAKALMAEVALRASALASKAPIAIAGLKANLNASHNLDMAGYLDAECARVINTMTTRDHQEAAAAFLEKRDPIFEGH